jgi:acetylornithine deacetylase/succinyl-diaminopimelate desuccinylase-like protein
LASSMFRSSAAWDAGTGMTSDVETVFAEIDRTFESSVERLEQFLRIPSVGTDPAYAEDTRHCARWLADELAGLGMAASVRETHGQPIVMAHDHGAPADAPHLLYYGHYDVQPADPLELWTSPPFEPARVEGPRGPRLVARGAVDDKGQVMTWVEAFRAWKAVHGNLPVRVTAFVEGEEESSSRNLAPFIVSNREELAADVCVISDTGMLGVDRPAITTMLRGIVYVEVTLHGPSHDLHSGMYGGAVVNPINALVGVLAHLHDDQGRVQIPGFYDYVRELPPDILRSWQELGLDERIFLAGAGLTRSTGEVRRSLLERIWSRPTCDINGIWGGYTGEGAKTVIAAKASAKLSCRLVADQDAEKVLAGLGRFFAERTPDGCRIEVAEFGASGAVRVDTTSPFLAAARAGLRDAFGREPALIGAGGSIPVVLKLKELLGLDSLLVGFGLDDDRVHSPNEKFELACYKQGIRTHAAMLSRFAGIGR